MTDFISAIDSYKIGHVRDYPTGTQYVYSNFTARGSRVEGQKHVIHCGRQYFLDAILTKNAQETFFGQPKRKVLEKYRRMVDDHLGPNQVNTDHIGALHDLGYIPLQFWGLPEGTHVPLRMPMFTFQNTLPEFFWLTNYIEDMLSNCLWLPCTSATTAHRYRKLLDGFAALTGGDPEFVKWQGHDFSCRGMQSMQAAAMSGFGHLLSFTGTDTLPAVELIRDYYEPQGVIASSVSATEHSVMCAGGEENEYDTYSRLLDLYPSGILSVVSDTWDLYGSVIGKILPDLKDRIMARPGKLTIRPDSGIPEDILCGDANAPEKSLARKGVVQCLWDIFGGTANAKGLKELDPHIGAIYGDSITEQRARNICLRLSANGFASTNVILGIGSFTYSFVTRDTYGFAVKATWCQVNGQERLLCKTPKTDDGVKNSARGRIAIVQGEKDIEMRDGLTLEQHEWLSNVDLLKPVWRDGKFLRRQSLNDIRARVAAGPGAVIV